MLSPKIKTATGGYMHLFFCSKSKKNKMELLINNILFLIFVLL